METCLLKWVGLQQARQAHNEIFWNELFDCETGKELLNGSNKVQGMEIFKNIEYEKEYKLRVTWENKENMSETNDVDIVVSASQKKG